MSDRAPTYFELEEALERAALQVETMSAIIGCFLEDHGQFEYTIDELRHNYETFNVIVTPNGKESITISLEKKNDK